MKHFLDEMKKFIESTADRLLDMADSEVHKKRDDSYWSTAEILGHLIDSACNNHRRFVLAQFKSDLVFDGYDQDKWTAVQNYIGEDWQTLVLLWKNYNFHIIHLCGQIPENLLEKKRLSHNLNQIAWKKIDKSSSVTLEYFIKDYFGHLKHHIEQLFSISS
ncbi:MAG: hypothetical protein FJ213_10050 [Ignavibacteria bacterium]|nr:hypothetical protein [Ignavibacteria bacterium]